MDAKKIVLCTVILIIAISSLSIVSAGWFDFGDSSINGIEFNLTGFKETDYGELPDLISNDGLNVETKNYKDKKGKLLAVRVYENPNANFTLDNLTLNVTSNVYMDKLDFDGKQCLKIVDETEGGLAYVKDGKLVLIEGNDTNGGGLSRNWYDFTALNGDYIEIEDIVKENI